MQDSEKSRTAQLALSGSSKAKRLFKTTLIIEQTYDFVKVIVFGPRSGPA